MGYLCFPSSIFPDFYYQWKRCHPDNFSLQQKRQPVFFQGQLVCGTIMGPLVVPLPLIVSRHSFCFVGSQKGKHFVVQC